MGLKGLEQGFFYHFFRKAVKLFSQEQFSSMSRRGEYFA